jgi:hypothetical protein
LRLRRTLAFPAIGVLVVLLAGCNDAASPKAASDLSSVDSAWSHSTDGATSVPPATSVPSASATDPSQADRGQRPDLPVTSEPGSAPTAHPSSGGSAGQRTPGRSSTSASTPGTSTSSGSPRTAGTPSSAGTTTGTTTTGTTTTGATTGATTAAASGFDVVEEFGRDVPAGSWPGNGSAPAAYSKYVSYADGTSGKYFPSQVLSVHDGVLDWNCHASMAAAVLPFGYSGFTFGTYTVRMRSDDFSGYHIAFLLWPNTNKWTHEIDGPESNTSTSNPYPAVLQSASPTVFAPAHQVSAPASWHDAAFHDYTWQWTPTSLSFYQDGTLVTTVTGNVPNEGMHPVLQVEWANSSNVKPDPSITGHVYVDRVMYDADYTVPVPTA